MSFSDTVRLALRNLGQAKLRTALTVLGVSIGIASLSGMVSLGVGLQDQVVGRFTQSGMFDSITVFSPGRFGGAGARGRAARGQSQDTAKKVRLDDEALKTLGELPNVTAVNPSVPIAVQLRLDEHTQFMQAAGVPMSAKTQGAFQTIAHGQFFANETDDACMVSLQFANNLSEDPKSLVGRTLTLSYAVSGPPLPGEKTEALPPGLPGVGTAGMQVRRVETTCPVVGIVQRETGPGIGGAGSVSPLMIPLAKARAIYAVQMSAQAVLRGMTDERTYPSVTIQVSSARHTQEVEDKIKALGYDAFSLNDLLQGAKRAFIIIDIILGLIGSIALTVSSLGIVNTMVMSILERTREIGVMKAIGGGDRDIRKIFLIEASVIGVIGGAAGVLLGWIVGRVINFGANVYVRSQGVEDSTFNLFTLPLWLIAGAIGFSVVVSLLAGSYPARRAARLDPIQALRHD